jgi:branched-chain amino acid transport system substrate-binding protein
MSRRKWVAVALGALAVIVGAAIVLGGCGSSSSSSSSSTSSTSSSASTAAGGTIKVGFVNSATGVSAAPNQAIVGATQGAIGQINAAGGIDGKWKIDAISKDDGSDVAKASAAVTQLIQQDKVDFILQPWVDFIAPVARGIEEKAGIPGVLSYAPAKGHENDTFKWTFSNAQGAKDNADALVKIFAQKGWKTVVGVGDVLTIQQDTLDYVGEMASSQGITFTKLKDQWPLDQTDFSGLASKIVAACTSAKADVLCLMITAPQADAMMKALKGAGLTIPVIGGPTLAQAQPLFAAGTKNVDGMYFISTAVTAGPQLPDSYPGKPVVVGFYNAVMAQTKNPPDNFAAWANDAVSLMAEAVKKAGSTDKAAVRDAFESIQGFQGVAGMYNYSATDHVGIHGGMWLYQIKNGKYILQGNKSIN